MDCENPLHARHGELRVTQEVRRVGKSKQLGQVQQRTRPLLAADDREVILQAVEIGCEHDASLVELRGRFEDMPRQRDRRRQDLLVGLEVVVGERRQSRACRGSNDIEDAGQRIGVALPVAGHELGDDGTPQLFVPADPNVTSFFVNVTNETPVVTGGLVEDVIFTDFGKTAYTFTVQYNDVAGINILTLDANDVTVTGPDGSLTVTDVSVNNPTDGSPRISACNGFASPARGSVQSRA